MTRAAARISSAGTPQIPATRSGGYRMTIRSSRSKHTVCASTKAWSTQPLAISSCWIPFSSAMLVPLRIGRWTSAARATLVGRGSTTTRRGRSGPCRRSSTRAHSTVCVSAMLWPIAKMVSQWSKSVSDPGAPSDPNVSLRAKSAVAVHRRVLPSRCGVPIPPRTTSASV